MCKIVEKIAFKMPHEHKRDRKYSMVSDNREFIEKYPFAMFVYVSKLQIDFSFILSFLDQYVQCSMAKDYISLTQITRMILIFRLHCHRAQYQRLVMMNWYRFRFGT